MAPGFCCLQYGKCKRVTEADRLPWALTVEGLHGAETKTEIRSLQFQEGFFPTDKSLIHTDHTLIGEGNPLEIELFHPAILNIYPKPLRPDAESQKDKGISVQCFHMYHLPENCKCCLVVYRYITCESRFARVLFPFDLEMKSSGNRCRILEYSISAGVEMWDLWNGDFYPCRRAGTMQMASAQKSS